MIKKDNVFGMAAALAANIIFGFSFLFSKTALLYAHPLIVLNTRFTVAFAALNLLVVFRIVKIDYRNKKLGGLLLMSIAQPLLYFIFELYGIKFCSSALSGIIIALVPVGVMLLSGITLGEKTTILQKVCAAVSLAGVSAVSVLSDDKGKSTLLGIALLVLAVLSASAFNILSRKQSEYFSPIEKTYFMFLVGFVGFNAVSFAVFRGKTFEYIISAFSNGGFVVSVVYLAVISSVAAFMLYNYSTSKISAVQAASFSNIITVVSVAAGVVFLKEPLSAWQILLCVPIILGVWGVNRPQNKV